MKKKNQNLITWKIEYRCDDDFSEYIENYNKVLRFTYNRLFENPDMSTKEVTEMQKSMKHKPENVGSHLMNCTRYDALALIETSDEPIIFGGKDNFVKRCQNKIDKATFLKNRLLPLYSIGESPQYGNRLFTIKSNLTIIFKPDRQHHYELTLLNIGKNRRKDFEKLIELQNNKNIAITYKIDDKYIYITFDYSKLEQSFYKVKKNRIIAIDMNPNSVGWSIVDWFDSNKYNVVASGIFSLKPLNDKQQSEHIASNHSKSKYYNNKRKHEIIDIASELFTLCKHYKCEVFAMEDLNIESKDLQKGKSTNRLTQNQWCRNLLANQIRKRIKSSSTLLVEVLPQYSSFVGNLIFRKLRLPDECLASIEIGRRGFEFSTQYIFKRRLPKKVIVFPENDSVNSQLSISLAEIGIDVSESIDWYKLYTVIKESKTKYRFSLSDALIAHSESLFSKFYKQKYLQTYIFV